MWFNSMQREEPYLGAGRIVYQDFTRITKAIDDGEFDSTPALVENIDKAVHANKAVHLAHI